MYTSLNPGAIGVTVDSLEQGLVLAADHGFDGYHFSISEVAQLGVERVRQMCDKTGVRLSAFGFPVEFRQDGDALEDGLSLLESQAAIAAQLDVRRTATWISPASDELTFEQNLEQHVERLRPAAQILDNHGIWLGLEYVGPLRSREGKKHSFVHSMDQMADLCAAIGGNVGFLLDAWHWYTAGEDSTHLQRLQPEQIVDVHVNDAPDKAVDAQIDNQRELPGATGVIDIVTFLTALKRVGYDGPVMVEPFSASLREMSAEDACATTATALRSIWDQAGL